MVESFHGVVEVLEGGLAEVVAQTSPWIVDANGAATQDAQYENGIAVVPTA